MAYRVETHPKKRKNVSMVLFDGTDACGAFIVEWSGGELFWVVDPGGPNRKLMFKTQGVSVPVLAGNYVVNGGESDYYPMPAAEADQYYDLGGDPLPITLELATAGLAGAVRRSDTTGVAQYLDLCRELRAQAVPIHKCGNPYCQCTAKKRD